MEKHLFLGDEAVAQGVEEVVPHCAPQVPSASRAGRRRLQDWAPRRESAQRQPWKHPDGMEDGPCLVEAATTNRNAPVLVQHIVSGAGRRAENVIDHRPGTLNPGASHGHGRLRAGPASGRVCSAAHTGAKG